MAAGQEASLQLLLAALLYGHIHSTLAAARYRTWTVVVVLRT